MNGGHYLCPQMVWMLTHLIKAVSDHQPVFCGFYFSFTVFMMLLFADAHAFVAYRLHGVNAAVGLCTTHDLVM